MAQKLFIWKLSCLYQAQVVWENINTRSNQSRIISCSSRLLETFQTLKSYLSRASLWLELQKSALQAFVTKGQQWENSDPDSIQFHCHTQNKPVRKVNSKYISELQKYIYIWPMNFVNQLNKFKILFKEKYLLKSSDLKMIKSLPLRCGRDFPGQPLQPL